MKKANLGRTDLAVSDVWVLDCLKLMRVRE